MSPGWADIAVVAGDTASTLAASAGTATSARTRRDVRGHGRPVRIAGGDRAGGGLWRRPDGALLVADRALAVEKAPLGPRVSRGDARRSVAALVEPWSCRAGTGRQHPPVVPPGAGGSAFSRSRTRSGSAPRRESGKLQQMLPWRYPTVTPATPATQRRSVATPAMGSPIESS